MKQLVILLPVVALLFHYLSNGVEAVNCEMDQITTEGRLRKKLFCNYDKDNRPILTGGTLTVNFTLLLTGFLFEDADGKMTVSSWMHMTWVDEHLKWSPDEYDHLESITQSGETLWRPNIALYNTDVASTNGEFCKDSNCIVNSNGEVSCIPPCSHVAQCAPNYARWPFDRQNCTLHLGSWLEAGSEISFRVFETHILEDENVLSSQNMEWQLIQTTYCRNDNKNPNQTYSTLKFSFYIGRHSAMNSACILSSGLVLVLLNLISLWVDSTHNHRLILLSLSMIGHWIFLQHLLWVLPHNGDSVPDMLIFFRDSTLITALLIINTIIIQAMMSCRVQTPEWIEKTTTYMDQNRAGQMFMTKHLISNNFGNHSESNGDGINLVESQAEQAEAAKPVSPKTWRTFGNILDRVLFAFFCLIYLIMMISLLPENFLDAKEVKEVEIIGY